MGICVCVIPDDEADGTLFARSAVRPFGYVKKGQSLPLAVADGDGFAYDDMGGYYSVAAYWGRGWDVRVKAEFSGLTVAGIESQAVWLNRAGASVFVPASVETVGARAVELQGSVRCEAESRPEGWDAGWTSCGDVSWGCSS